MIASPVSPSASKSPNTRTRSPSRLARAIRSQERPASGSSAGSWRPASGAPKNASSAAGPATPRLARSRVTRGRARAGLPRRGSRRRRCGFAREHASGSGARSRRQDARSGCTATLPALRWRSTPGCGAAATREPVRRRPAASSGRGSSRPAAALVVPVLPDDEERRRVEDRRVRPRDDADQQGQDEVPDRRRRRTAAARAASARP